MKYYILPALFVFTGITHFFKPDEFAKIVPPFFPYPVLVGILAGLAELVLAAGLAYKPSRKIMGYLTMIFLLAIFPANVYMYLARETTFPELPGWALLLRLPLQFLLIWWAYAYTRPAAERA